MSDILERLRGYNPPDRTDERQRQVAIDIQDAIREIAALKAEVERLNRKLIAERAGPNLCDEDGSLKEAATISDGFGATWSKKCPMCGKDTMEIVRPGWVQCGNCG